MANVMTCGERFDHFHHVRVHFCERRENNPSSFMLQISSLPSTLPHRCRSDPGWTASAACSESWEVHRPRHPSSARWNWDPARGRLALGFRTVRWARGAALPVAACRRRWTGVPGRWWWRRTDATSRGQNWPWLCRRRGFPRGEGRVGVAYSRGGAQRWAVKSPQLLIRLSGRLEDEKNLVIVRA